MSIADKLTQLAAAKQNIKQAIIDKGVDLTGVPFTSYHTKIAEITGGGSGEVPIDPSKPLVRFIDYDGTILKQESVDIGGSATPPDLPDYSEATNKRPALTFQGWNRDFTNITEDRDIGAIYIPTDGKTHAYVRLTKVSGKDVPLYLNKTDASTLSIDWGDGTTTTHTDSGNFNTSHTYSDYGDYEIKIWISSGSGLYSFGNGTSNYIFVGGALQTQKNMLMYLFIGNNVSSTGNYAFHSCHSLTNIVIPESVSSIGPYAFYSCYSLTSINLPASVSSIINYAFRNCYSLTNVVIPESVSSIGNYAFYYCYSLTSINIPASVSSIGSYAFHSCYSLTSINLPASVSSIGMYAFSSCYSLTSISIPAGVSSIGSYAFNSCYSLTSINIPASVSSIGSYAFYNCYSLTSINLPASVSSIGDYAFENCYSILKYVFNRTTPPTLANKAAFNDINSVCKIYVPDGRVNAYKSATNWVNYADYIYPMSEM
jgi:hypothetical protein